MVQHLPLHQTVLPTLTHTGLSTQISMGSAGTELPGCGDFTLEKKVKQAVAEVVPSSYLAYVEI